MTQSNDRGNKGVIVVGGTLSADNLAVGKNASISNSGNSQEYSESALQQLTVEVSRLIDHMKESQIDRKQIEAVTLAKSELESDSPNLFLAKSVLLSVVDGLKTIGSVSGSIMSIKKLLGILLP